MQVTSTDIIKLKKKELLGENQATTYEQHAIVSVKYRGVNCRGDSTTLGPCKELCCMQIHTWTRKL